MAVIRIHLDKRTVRKDGASPLKLSICHKGRTSLVSLGVFVRPENWNEAAEKVAGLPNRTNLNAFILQKRLDAENAALKLSADGTLDGMSLQQLKRAVLGEEEKAKPAPHGFAGAFREFMGLKERPGTRSVYRQTWVKLQAFCPEIESLAYEDITRGWLTEFDVFMARTCPSRNARNIHLRNVRAVFNYAIDEGYTSAYPFRRFKIRDEETRKRFLPAGRLRELRDYPYEAHQAKYRDMFMLMLYLAGINPADLFQARKRDVRGGRLEYRRAKTGKLYSVKIEPEAQELISRHAGKGEWLLDVMDRYGDYRDFLHRMNRELKRIGPAVRKGRGGRKEVQPLFPELSAYWARHSWATLAYRLGVPLDTVSEALGHEHGSRVTCIYIAFDRRKADAANRLVLDFLAGGGEE